jgi:hypothetical protein
MGPYAGFLGGWAICTTGILVIGSLPDVSALFLYDLFELNDLRKSDLANVALAVAIIGVRWSAPFRTSCFRCPSARCWSCPRVRAEPAGRASVV